MGIRFFCPNGHKLHVKEFQAGRRGICPHCGVSMDIPLTSTRPSSKKRPKDAANGEGDVSGVVRVEQHESDPIPLEDHMLLSGAAASTSTPPAAAASSVATTSAAVAGATPRPASNIPAPGAPPAHGPRRPVDPLDEVPTAVWYVRPPSGGQFGPATRDVMRAWLAEGRVSADSLVWREGWRDWNTASEVFPQFSAAAKTPPHLDFLDDEIPRSTTTVRKSPAAATSPTGKTAKPPKSPWLWVGIGLGAIVLLASLGAFVYVRFF